MEVKKQSFPQIALAQNSIYSMLKKAMLFTLRQNDIYWKLKPYDSALNMKIIIIWPDAIVLVTLFIENPLKLMHTFNMLRFVTVRANNTTSSRFQ